MLSLRVIALIGILCAVPLGAQDIELWGQLNGNPVPNGYRDMVDRNPDAFRFNRGLRPEGGVRANRGDPASVVGFGGLPISGVIRLPVLLGTYVDQAEPQVPRAEIQSEFFDGPSSRNQTVSDYYAAASSGRIELVGRVQEWLPSTLTGLEVTGETAGVGDDSRIDDWILELLAGLEERGFDWSPFDNDGPDGLPNSGDDDGFVDIVGLLHPTAGGECSPRVGAIWSHRWNLEGWGRDPFVTGTASANGGSLRVDDYFVSGSLHCSGFGINFIGTFTHELGHGFGLPDLYGVGAEHPGTGYWDLMGWGSVGCSGENRGVPCDLSAWSKAQLGWVDVENIPPMGDIEIELGPIETTPTVYRMDAVDGSDDYYLLENRQGVGTDRRLRNTGLLLWRIDADLVSATWDDNRVNSDPNRMGVTLIEADGADNLARVQQGGGDAGDPFPGAQRNSEFHASSRPSSRTHGGTAGGVTLLDIHEVEDRIRLRAVTGFRDVTLRVAGVDGATDQLLSLDGTVVSDGHTFPTAPFDPHELVAAWGVETGPDERNGFGQWEDGSGAARTFIPPPRNGEAVATYGRPEVRFTMAVDGMVEGIEPGDISTQPASEGGWITTGTDVIVSATPRTGFGFLSWGGDLEGQPNPAVIRIDEPGGGSAMFEPIFTLTSPSNEVDLAGGNSASIRFEARNANFPIELSIGEGRIPNGMTLDSSRGLLEGRPMEMGTFVLEVLAVDHIGLVAQTTVAVRVGPPTATVTDLAGHFRPRRTGQIAPILQLFMDLNGNRNGEYDLGDFRAFMLANPDLPVGRFVEQPEASRLRGRGR